MQAAQLTIRTDSQLISNSVPTSRILEIELTAPEAQLGRESTPLNLALVIDRSGSMSGGKLEQAKVAVRQILDLLRPVDSVTSPAANRDAVRCTKCLPTFPSSPASRNGTRRWRAACA